MFIDYVFDTARVSEGFVIAFVAGLIVSFVFIFILLRFFRPSFALCHHICKNEVTELVNGNMERRDKYSFKIVNKSVFPAYDVKIELFLMEPVGHDHANVNLKIQPVELRTSNLTHIRRYTKNYHKKDPFALFATIVHTYMPLEGMLVGNNYLELIVTAKHGLTGLGATFTQQYTKKADIAARHKFGYANATNVIQSN